MSILGALKRQTESIDDLAKLPQAMIMQMAQKGQIREDMLAPILGRKAEMADAIARMQALQGNNQTPPSVLEQVMATNAMAEQPEMENTGVAQLPVPEREYAGGGIIAFSRGSLISNDDDDEIDPYDDYAKAAAFAQRANSMPVGRSLLPQSYEAALAEKGQTPASVRKMMIDGPKKGDYVMPPTDVPKRGGHKYESMVIQEAQRLGIDPNLAVHVLYKETGNLKDPETARSKAGAIGVMQLMPKTAKGLGVDPLNPEENIRGGVTYLKQMYDKYQDPTLALAAYNAGPGRLDKALKSGQGIMGLPRETQNYVRMASGGEVKHFQYGGSTMSGFDNSYTDIGVPLISEIDEYTIDPMTGQKLFSGYGKPSKKKETIKKETPVETKKTPDVDNVPTIDNKASAVTQTKAPEVTPKTPMELFLEQNAADREALGKQRSEDRNMALLAAGLGMMGGTSPYAFANIGQGGLSGVSYLSETNKQRAAQQAALDKNRIAAMHYQNIGDYYKSGIASKEEKLALQQQQVLQRGVAEKERLANAQAVAYLKANPMAGFNAEDPTSVAQFANQILAKDPAYKKMYQGLHGFEYNIGPGDFSGFKVLGQKEKKGS